MGFEMKSLKTKNIQLENDNLTRFEEIKLLKDYVYGMDKKAKEVHKHKFLMKPNNKNFDSNNSHTLSNNCFSCG